MTFPANIEPSWLARLGIEGLDQFRHTKMVLIDPEVREQQGWFPYADAEAWPGVN